MTRLYARHKLLQFQELASKNWEWPLELIINCTYNNQDDTGQVTGDQFEDDCQR